MRGLEQELRVIPGDCQTSWVGITGAGLDISVGQWMRKEWKHLDSQSALKYEFAIKVLL